MVGTIRAQNKRTNFPLWLTRKHPPQSKIYRLNRPKSLDSAAYEVSPLLCTRKHKETPFRPIQETYIRKVRKVRPLYIRTGYDQTKDLNNGNETIHGQIFAYFDAYVRIKGENLFKQKGGGGTFLPLLCPPPLAGRLQKAAVGEVPVARASSVPGGAG